MEKKRLLAAVMAVLMVISLLPSMVFASAPAGELAGKLKIKGLAAVGTTLSADYTKAEPKDLTDDDVTFQWTRKIGDSEPEELGTDKTYKVTEEDLGYQIILKVTGKEELGLTGSLTAKTLEVSATEEEAKLLEEQNIEEAEDQDTENAAPEYEEPAEESDQEIPEILEIQNEEELNQDVPELQEIPVPQDTEVQQGESEEIPIYNEEELVLDGDGQGEEPYQETDEGQQQMEEVPEAENEAVEEEQEDFHEGVSQDSMQGTVMQDTGAEAIPAAEAVVDNENGVLDFGRIEAGADSEAQYVEIKNVGMSALNFSEISPEHFMVEDIYEPLEIGESVSVWVIPRAGLEPGTYEDTIVYTTEEGADASFAASVIVENQDSQPAETEEETIDETAGEETADNIVEEETAADNTVEEEMTADNTVEEETAADNTVEEETDTDNTADEETIIDDIADEEIITDNTAEDETTEDDTAVEEPEVLSVSVTAEPSALEPYTLNEGYEQTEPRIVVVTNTGNTPVILQQPVSESGFFSIGEISAETLDAGETAQFTVQPANDLEAGTYDELIKVMGSAEGNDPQEFAAVSAYVVVEKEEVHSLSVSPSVLDFGSSKEGYEKSPEAQKVTVTNDGTSTIIIGTPESVSFNIGELSQDTIAPGESCTFNVRPKTRLTESLYLETILIPNDVQTAAQVDAQFEVTKAAVNLTGIQPPVDISGIKNGAEKSADGLKLPSSVTIKTTAGKMKAKVKWNVSGCEYNPASKEAQTFKVNGTVVLPDGVNNPDDLSLITSVKVSVKAGYTPKKADPADNKITGISSSGYTTQSKITFTAVGAGMDNTSPRKGDERYVPFNWTVINTNSWQEAPYTATFGITKSGTYTLTVNFVHQKYDGSSWVNTDLKDAKQVNFSIAEAQVITPTSTPIPGAANQRNAVLTGDDTNIMIFVVILAIAVGSIVGVLVYKKKHK